MKRLANNRSDYLRLLAAYKTKRKLINAQREQYGDTYEERIKKVKTKITTYQCAIRRMDAIKAKLNDLAGALKNYYGYSVYNSVYHWRGNRKREKILVRAMFCKYAIDNLTNGRYVSDFVGWKDKTEASRQRLKFGKALQNNEHYAAQWKKFKKAIQNKTE